MKRSKIFLSAVLAGLCVGFGGIVFLSVDNKVIGSAAFTIVPGRSVMCCRMIETMRLISL